MDNVGSEHDKVNELTKLFQTALTAGHNAAMETLIETKVKDRSFQLNIDQCVLMTAARGNATVLASLLSLYPRMSYTDSLGRRAIHYAAKNGHLACVERLLRGGAISNCSDTAGFTPLHLACVYKHEEIVSLLLRQCAHVNSCRTELGESAVHTTAKVGHVTVMAELVAFGADLNAPTRRNKGGETPLHKAVAADKPEMVSFLLSHGAATNIADAYGKSPAHVAAERGLVTCLEMLLERGVSLELRDCHGQTPLNAAITENQTEVANLLIDQGADVHTVGDNGFSLLHKATLRCNLDLISRLVSAGCDVNVRNPTSLQSPLLSAVMMGKLSAVQKLIELGADVTLPDNKGLTALHMAQYKPGGDRVEEIVLALLQAGGRLDVRDDGNYTPLQRCVVNGVSRRQLSLPSLQLMCQAGAELGPDQLSMGKKSPLFWLAYSGFLSEALYLCRAGWSLSDEVWLVLPGKDERQDRLHHALIDMFRTVPTLLACSRKVLRRQLSAARGHREIMSGVAQLPIPRPLKSFLLLKDIDPSDLRVLGDSA